MTSPNRYPNRDRYINFLTEIANFSPAEQDDYENSLKYYRDLNNVVSTSREEGRVEGRAEERSLFLQQQRQLFTEMLIQKLGALPQPIQEQLELLELEALQTLGKTMLSFTVLEDLEQWLNLSDD